MKKLFLLLATAFVCFACTNTKDVVTVTVSNPLAMERSNEMVEVAMSDIANQLKLADTAQIVVLNADGQQVPYQITYDEKVIFPASVAANGTAVYTIQAGTPEAFAVKACGRYYPERVDDVAWENDLDTIPVQLSDQFSVRMVLLCKRLANVLSVMMFGRSTIPPNRL